MGFQGPQTAMDVGGMQQAQFQQGINEAQNRYYYPETKSQGMLDWLNNIFTTGGALGQSTTSTVPGNPLGGAIGGASLGYGLMQGFNSGSGGQTVNPGIDMSAWSTPGSNSWAQTNPL